MTSYGFGGKEEEVYLKAFRLAEAGKPTLLFCFESETSKLYKILASHILEIDVKDVTASQLSKLKEQLEIKGDIPLSFIDTASMPFEDIIEVIRRSKLNKGTTDVVFDRVDDLNAISSITSKLDVTVHY